MMAFAQSICDQNIEAELQEIASKQNIKIGLFAQNLRSNEIIAVNAEKTFPLASTYKIPMAGYAFHLVEKGTLKLTDLIEVSPADHVTSSPLAEACPHPGLLVSLLNLLEPMLIYSDNTATDVVLRTIGGGKAVTEWLRSIGIKDLSIDRSTGDLITDYIQVPNDNGLSPADHINSVIHSESALSQAWNDNIYAALLEDPRDSGTPKAMGELLSLLWEAKVISPQHADILKSVLKRCQTGPDRLSGCLPETALPIAHKTGTIGGTVNDAGVITLPNGTDIVMVIYAQGKVSWEPEDWKPAERVIAETARVVYDYFAKK